MRHIAIDIDQTIFPSFESLNLLPERKNCQLLVEDCTEYSKFGEQIGDGALEVFRRSFQFEHAKQIKPFQGVYETLQFLHKNNITITFLTHRNKIVFEETYQWIKHHNINYGQIICHPHNKIDWCLENNVSLLIDDHPDCIEDGLKRNFPVISLKWPYHQHIKDNYILFENWHQINHQLSKHLSLEVK